MCNNVLFVLGKIYFVFEDCVMACRSVEVHQHFGAVYDLSVGLNSEPGKKLCKILISSCVHE